MRSIGARPDAIAQAVFLIQSEAAVKTPDKVVGLVQASNEWPLLALSISHALMHHVDEVYVLNHSSTDGSCEGIRKLQGLWTDRIHVFNYYDNHFWQEACLSTLIELSRSASPDWVYVFDADEFMISREGRSLKEILGEVGSEYSVVRYDVQNWVSTEDFDETDLACYRLLRYRSVPNTFAYMQPETRTDKIRDGSLNYYDLPFPSKVLFRNHEALWVAAGTHALKVLPDSPTLEARSDALKAAHLPLLSRGRLEGKARTGRLEVQDHFPAGHGWQNQTMWALSQEGRLDEFWQSHSITFRSLSGDRALPSCVVDDIFVQAIEPVLCLLEKGFGSRTLPREGTQGPSSRELVDSQIPFRTAVHSARKLQMIADELHAELATCATQLSEIRGSTTWRISAPVRLAGRQAGRLSRCVRRDRIRRGACKLAGLLRR
jgi:hypothetical protein